jgi:GT2 family glycosyltransferase
LCAQTHPRTEFEILVVDNGSKDETRAIVEAFAPRVRYLYEGKRGRSAAQNCGIAHARGESIAFTDADCIAEPQWLGQLIEPLQDENVGVAGGAIHSVSTDSPIELFGEQIHNQEKAICVYKPPYVATANWASPRELLQTLGGFDESLVRGQDTDMAWRILQAGKQLAYQPQAIVYHRNERTVRAWFHAGYAHGYYSVWVTRKHEKFLQSFGYRRVNRNVYRRVIASFREYLTTRSITALCDAAFNSGKRLGKLTGSLRAGYLDL